MASLKKNIGASFVGNLVYALSQWLLIIVLSKLGGTQVIGVYALALAVVSPAFALANMNLRAVQSTDTDRPVDYASYARFRHLTSLICILACLVISVAFYFDKSDICLSIICLAFYKYFESESDLAHGYIQRQERMDLIAKSIMLRGIGNVVVVGSVFYFTNDLVEALAASIIKSWAISFFIDARNKRRLYKQEAYQIKTFRELFAIAWPLGVVVFGNTLNLNIPRYFIAQYFDENMVGVFASISYFIVAGSTLVNAIAMSASPRLAKYSISDYKKFRTLSRQIFLLITLVGLVGVFIAEYLGHIILSLVYTNAIAQYHDLFTQIMWSGVAIYASAAAGTSVTALRDFKSQSALAIITIIVMLASCYWLIRDYQLAGAAAAIAITHVVKLIWFWVRFLLNRATVRALSPSN